MSRLMQCGLMSWVILCSSVPVWADDAEDNSIEFVEKLGGEVNPDSKRPGKPVIEVELASSRVTDAGLKELAGLKNLTTIELDFTLVTDAGLKELAGLKSLTTLELGYTKVTDAGLKELAGLKNLTTLKLSSTPVTGVGLKELQKALPKCKIPQ